MTGRGGVCTLPAPGEVSEPALMYPRDAFGVSSNVRNPLVAWSDLTQDTAGEVAGR